MPASETVPLKVIRNAKCIEEAKEEKPSHNRYLLKKMLMVDGSLVHAKLCTEKNVNISGPHILLGHVKHQCILLDPTRVRNPQQKSSSIMESTHFQLPVQGVISSPSSSYIVEKHLGRGRFGVVSQCKKMPANETVALKVIGNNEYIEEAKEEEEILRKLKQHNSDKFNVIRLNDSFLYQGWHCLDFEKLDMTLSEFMKKSPSMFLALKDIRPILQQLATTLQFLESLGIAHADLKPENIMVEDHLQQPLKVKVIDFGLASEVSKMPRGTVVQTLCYRAPEILLGAPFSEAMDVWSLGCTAAEMFIGQVLFSGASEYDMMMHILNTIGKPPDHLLNDGMYTVLFFNPTGMGQNPNGWTSKTPMKNGFYSCTLRTINCLNDLLAMIQKTPHNLSGKDARADHHDRACFVDLLKKMLTIDASGRITPSQILQHPFLTMSHLTGKFSTSQHVKSCRDLMALSSNHGEESSQSSIKWCLRGTTSKNRAGLPRRVLIEGQPVGLRPEEKVQRCIRESIRIKRRRGERDECASRTAEKPPGKTRWSRRLAEPKTLLHKRQREDTSSVSLRSLRRRKRDVVLESGLYKRLRQRRKRRHVDYTYSKVT